MGLKEDILFLEIVYFLFGESSAATMAGGAQRPVGRGNEPKKDGCAQRTGAHARSKPTIFIIYLPRVLCLSYSCHIPVIFLSVVVAER